MGADDSVVVSSGGDGSVSHLLFRTLPDMVPVGQLHRRSLGNYYSLSIVVDDSHKLVACLAGSGSNYTLFRSCDNERTDSVYCRSPSQQYRGYTLLSITSHTTIYLNKQCMRAD